MEVTPEMEADNKTTTLSDDNVVDYLLSRDQEAVEATPEDDTEVEDVGDTPEDLDVEDTEPDIDKDEPEDEDPLYEVTEVGGSKKEVALSELVRSYSRESDYTKKTMALADENRAVAAKQAELDSVKAELQATQAKVSEQVDVFILDAEKQLRDAEKINLVQLSREDPDQAQQIQFLISAKRDELAKAKAAKDQSLQVSNEESQANSAKYLEAQRELLLSTMPEMQEPKKAQAVFDRVNKALAEHHFNNDEISQVSDARIIRLLDKAAKWDELQAKKPKKVKDAEKLPKFQKAGRLPNKSKVDRVKKAADFEKAKGGDKASVEDYIMKHIKL